MCTRTLTVRRYPRPDDLTFSHQQTPSSPPPPSSAFPGNQTSSFTSSLSSPSPSSSPSSSTQGWRPLIWPSNRWRLSTTSLCFSLVIFVWTFPASAWGVQTTASPHPKVLRNTVYGKIQGYARELFPGKYVEYYLGVPYAAPPIGDLRFENPEEPKHWKDTLTTDKYPAACLQNDKTYVRDHRVEFFKYDEDCLYLNIYVPRTTKKELLPVFAFVHGGSNIVGMAAMHDGDVFASHTDVIVVMMNYRLGPFGFLTLGEPDLAGNYGLMDQLLALRWIQANIGFFGGDKNKVTLSGHSAGGADVGAHTLSSLAKGLFRYSICQSGSSMAYWAVLQTDESFLKPVRDYIRRLDCFEGTPLEIKLCIRDKPAKSIITTWMQPNPTGYSFFATEYKYLRDSPEHLFASGPLNSETIMLGVTKNEGTLAGLQMEDFGTSKFMDLMNVGKATFFPQLPNIDDLLIHEYTQWENPNLVNSDSARISLSQMFGDHSLTYPTYHCAELLARRNFSVYFYTFFHKSSEDKRPDWVGVPHGEDIFYMFGSPLVGHALRNYTNLDKEVSKKYMEFFGNFVKTGKAFIGTQEFEHYTSEDKQMIKFYSKNDTALVGHENNFLRRRMDFWDNLIPTLRNKTILEKETLGDREERQAHKTFIFQLVTGFFVALCIILMSTTVFILTILYKRRKNNFSVPTTTLVTTQNTPLNTAETPVVVFDTKDTTAHLLSSEAKKSQTKTYISPKNA